MEHLSIHSDLPHELQAVTLLQLLSNPLILHQTIPYLPLSATLALGATSKSFKNLIHHTPGVFRHLDLRNNKLAQSANIGKIDTGGQVFRASRCDEGVTESDFHSGPLTGIFNNLRRRDILKDVQTLVLDGLSFSWKIPIEIILDNAYNVRLLSMRDVQNLNDRALIQAIQYAIRFSRSEGPKLKGLYIFGPKDPPSFRSHQSQPLLVDDSITAVAASIGSSWNQKSSDHLSQSLYGTSEKWYRKSGKMIQKTPMDDWGSVLLQCKGLISFDAPLCSGPRHTLPTQAKDGSMECGPWYQKEEFYIPPRVATFALEGCHSCGKAPEGLAKFGRSPDERFPLLSPVPIHSSTIKAAKCPDLQPSTSSSTQPHIIARCGECILNRYCENCYKWWCEDCYDISAKGDNVHPPSMAHQEGAHHDTESVSKQPSAQLSRSELESNHVKVYSGLCVQDCLIGDLLVNDMLWNS